MKGLITLCLLAVGMVACKPVATADDWFEQGQAVGASVAWVGPCRVSIAIRPVPGSVRGRTLLATTDTCRGQ